MHVGERYFVALPPSEAELEVANNRAARVRESALKIRNIIDEILPEPTYEATNTDGRKVGSVEKTNDDGQILRLGSYLIGGGGSPDSRISFVVCETPAGDEDKDGWVETVEVITHLEGRDIEVHDLRRVIHELKNPYEPRYEVAATSAPQIWPGMHGAGTPTDLLESEGLATQVAFNISGDIPMASLPEGTTYEDRIKIREDILADHQQATSIQP